jgi:hypothetical protein
MDGVFLMALILAFLIVVQNNCWLRVDSVRTVQHSGRWFVDTTLRNPSMYQTDDVMVAYHVQTPTGAFWSAPLVTAQTFPGHTRRTVHYPVEPSDFPFHVDAVRLYCQ